MRDTTTTLAMRWVDRRERIGEIATLTATTYRETVRGFAAVAPDDPSKIDKRHVDKWLTTTRHLAAGTRRNRYSVVRCFLRWLQEEGHLRRDPLRGRKAPKAPRAVHRSLAKEQVIDLLKACENPRDRLIVVFAHQMGLRRAEIAGLEMGDINLALRVLVVTGKGSKQRRVPLTKAAVKELDRYLAWAGVSAGPLLRLPSDDTRPLKPVWIGRRIADIAYDSGVKARPRDGVGTHSLRHTTATEMHENGAPLTVIRDLLGHGSLATTEIYVRGLGMEAMREAMEGRTYDAEGEAA